MFPELPEFLERGAKPHCNRCLYRASYGAEQNHCFGGVTLCRGCQAMWRGYVESLPERAKEVFMDIVLKAPPGLGAEEPTAEVKDKKLQNGRPMDNENYSYLPDGSVPLQNGNHTEGSVLVPLQQAVVG